MLLYDNNVFHSKNKINNLSDRCLSSFKKILYTYERICKIGEFSNFWMEHRNVKTCKDILWKWLFLFPVPNVDSLHGLVSLTLWTNYKIEAHGWILIFHCVNSLWVVPQASATQWSEWLAQISPHFNCCIYRYFCLCNPLFIKCVGMLQKRL